jgi:hypothetical protein
MHADILTNKDNMNCLRLTSYTMTYENIPQALYRKFVDEKYLDNTKCESVKQDRKDLQEYLEIEINVRK